MRLLKVGDRGEISLTEHASNATPPYAILSHTWGDEEVIFDDLATARSKSKIGWQKIRFCADQARRDGLEYIWVDTCCINKSNLTELSEALNSMYSWYHRANRCYVYLSDVSNSKRNHNSLDHHDSPRYRTWEPMFRAARWFTRGWTLQELLAPVSVEFFSREGHLLGNKTILASLIHEITNIDIRALHGAPLSEFPVTERMSWAATRRTTKPEDEVYCLLGIFDVFLPPIYGENKHAWVRLQDEIDKKSRSEMGGLGNAGPLDTSGAGTAFPRHSSPTPESTLSQSRLEELLNYLGFAHMDIRRDTIKSAYSSTCAWFLKTQKYMDWIDPQKFDQHRGFLWIRGKPGAGKSTLVKFANVQASRSPRNGEILVSHYFNARGDALEKSTLGMYRSLLYQLLGRIPHLYQDLGSMDNALGTAIRSPRFVWTIELLRELLTAVVQSLKEQRLRLKCFIDALDECDEQEISDMIRHFEDLGCISSDHFYVCFASRYYPSIVIRNGLQLDLEDDPGHDEGLNKYIRSHLSIGNGKTLAGIKEQVHEKANGVFLWAVLVIDILNKEFVRGKIHAVQQRLNEIPPKLSDLFKDILCRDCTDMDDLLLCIQWILFAKRPLERKEFYFAMMTGLGYDLAEWDHELVSEDDMTRYVHHCSKGLAELTRQKETRKESNNADGGARVQFIHESVKDFLIREGGLYKLWPELNTDFEGTTHDNLSKCCQRYLEVYSPDDALTSQTRETSSVARRDTRETVTRRFPFLAYSVEGTLFHADKAVQAVAPDNFLVNFNIKHWVLVANQVQKYQIRRYTEEAPLLYILADYGLSELIREFLKLKPEQSLAASKERDRYPFFAALRYKHWDAIRALLEPSSDPKVDEVTETLRLQRPTPADKQMEHPLRWAIDRDYEALAGVLASLPNADIASRTPELLRLAARRGYKNVVLRLLTSRCEEVAGNPWTESHDEASIIALKYGHMDIVELLLKNVEGIQQRWHDQFRCEALCRASERGCLDTVRLLLDKFASLGLWKGSSSNAPVTSASQRHQDSTGLDLNESIRCSTLESFHQAIHCASRYNHCETVELLLSRSLDAKADIADSAALFVAAKYGHSEVTKLLLQAGADATAHDGEALRAASSMGFNEIVKLLLDAGANVNVHGVNAAGNRAHQTYQKQLMLLEQQNKKRLLMAQQEQDAILNSQRNLPQQRATDALRAAQQEQDTRSHTQSDLAQIRARPTPPTPAYHLAGRECPLVNAVLNRRQETVKLLLDAGADTDAFDGKALFLALESGSKEVVKLLLDAGANVNVRNSKALITALAKGYHEVVELLLGAGADTNAFDGQALCLASESGSKEVVKLLLDAGADVDACRSRVLFAASLKGHHEVVKLLLDAGANFSAEADDALCAASRGGFEEVVKLLLDAGANVNSRFLEQQDQRRRPVLQQEQNTGSSTQLDLVQRHDREKGAPNALAVAQYVVTQSGPLVAAAKHGHRETVKLLLDAGADVDAHSSFGTALQAAAEQEHWHVVKLLLSVGASVYPRRDLLSDALLFASAAGDLDFAKSLLDIAADAVVWKPASSRKMPYGTSAERQNDGVEIADLNRALGLASARGHSGLVLLLLDAGADVNAYESNALLRAAKGGYDEVIKLLLDAGADLDVLKGQPLYSASDGGYSKTVKLLLDAGPNVDAWKGEALICASRRGNHKVVKLLLDAGADVDFLGGQPLCSASSGGHSKTVKLLLDAGANVNAWKVASYVGLSKIVKLLLDAGAVIKAEASDALYVASEMGFEEVVKLPKARVDADLQELNIGAALDAAPRNEHTELIGLQLGTGVNVPMDHSHSMQRGSQLRQQEETPRPTPEQDIHLPHHASQLQTVIPEHQYLDSGGVESLQRDETFIMSTLPSGAASRSRKRQRQTESAIVCQEAEQPLSGTNPDLGAHETSPDWSYDGGSALGVHHLDTSTVYGRYGNSAPEVSQIRHHAFGIQNETHSSTASFGVDVNRQTTQPEIVLQEQQDVGDSFSGQRLDTTEFDATMTPQTVPRLSHDRSIDSLQATGSTYYDAARNNMAASAESIPSLQRKQCGSALYSAAERGDVAAVSLLLQQEINVNDAGGAHGTAIQVASFGGHRAVVDVLLDAGAAICAPKSSGSNSNALQVAAEQGHCDVVRSILCKRTKTEYQAFYDRALYAALDRKHTDIAALLVEAGAGLSSASRSALHDYQVQLLLLDIQNKRRKLVNREDKGKGKATLI